MNQPRVLLPLNCMLPYHVSTELGLRQWELYQRRKEAMSPFLLPFPHSQTDHACQPCFRRFFFGGVGGGEKPKQQKTLLFTCTFFLYCFHDIIFLYFSFFSSFLKRILTLLPFSGISLSGSCVCLSNDSPMGHLSLQ